MDWMHNIMVSVIGHLVVIVLVLGVIVLGFGVFVLVLGVIVLGLGVFGVNVFGSLINDKNLVGIVHVLVENFGQIWIDIFVNFDI